jgi:hypothetical protein
MFNKERTLGYEVDSSKYRVHTFHWETSCACIESVINLWNILEYRRTERVQPDVMGVTIVVITRSVEKLVPQAARHAGALVKHVGDEVAETRHKVRIE